MVITIRNTDIPDKGLGLVMSLIQLCSDTEGADMLSISYTDSDGLVKLEIDTNPDRIQKVLEVIEEHKVKARKKIEHISKTVEDPSITADRQIREDRHYL